MSSLRDWSDLIQKQGKLHREQEAERIDRMAAELPGAIEGLSKRGNAELLGLLVEFSGMRHSPTENKIREAFRAAVEVEVLKRMVSPQERP